ncbi:hypothetical protein BH23BAC4_BH23BAC4_16730 [soil metagenome]
MTPKPLVLIAAVLFVALPVAIAQPVVIHDGLLGADLRLALVVDYKPSAVLTLAQSKDTLYARVDRVTEGAQDGVRGVYTGWFLHFSCDVDNNPGCDPSQDVFRGGSGINQEHIWPRSHGAASGFAERDMHNQAPSRVFVNAERGNLPFASIPDDIPSTWYSEQVSTTAVPPADVRHLWSQRRGSISFEPREDARGFIARAMFYFATVYSPSAGGQANMSYFDGMKEDLLMWHRAYPPDEHERARSERVAQYHTTSSGEPAVNPFAVDTSLATRAYFPEQWSTSVDEWVAGSALSVRVYPNPVSSTATLRVNSQAQTNLSVEVFDLLGRRVEFVFSGPSSSGPVDYALDTRSLPAGVYVVRVVAGDELMVRRFSVVR